MAWQANSFHCLARRESSDCRRPIVKTLHAYLTRQVIASLLMTVAVFTLVFLLGNFLNDILSLIVKGQASLAVVMETMGALLPFVMVFALPMALLTATLLVFGRFSADQELTAARAGGISLLSLVTPILLLSLLLCGVCAWVNLELGPRSRAAYKDLVFKFRAEVTGAMVPEGTYLKTFKDTMMYVGRNQNGKLENITIVQFGGGTNDSIIRAERGELHPDPGNQQIHVDLFNVKSLSSNGEHQLALATAKTRYTLRYSSDGKVGRKTRISYLTFWQLRAELRDVEATIMRAVPLGRLTATQLQERKAELAKQVNDLTSPLRVEMHRQVAFSFACFGFALIGIPLGIRVQRRETNISFAIALGLVLVYYGFLMVGNALASRPELSPHLIVWMPNFIFQSIGAVLLWRANRGN